MKYLILSFILFFIGLFGVLKRQNIVMFFISSEIMMNAANLALVASGALQDDLSGQVFALFIMAIAACEIAVGLALCVLRYRAKKSLDFSAGCERNFFGGEK